MKFCPSVAAACDSSSRVNLLLLVLVAEREREREPRFEKYFKSNLKVVGSERNFFDLLCHTPGGN